MKLWESFYYKIHIDTQCNNNKTVKVAIIRSCGQQLLKKGKDKTIPLCLSSYSGDTRM